MIDPPNLSKKDLYATPLRVTSPTLMLRLTNYCLLRENQILVHIVEMHRTGDGAYPARYQVSIASLRSVDCDSDCRDVVGSVVLARTKRLNLQTFCGLAQYPECKAAACTVSDFR